MTDTAVQRAKPQQREQREKREKREPGPDELLTEVEDRRQRLAGTIDTLLERTQPAALTGQAKQQVRDYFVTSEGEPRKEALIRVGVVAGCVLGGVGLLWLLRRKFHR